MKIIDLTKEYEDSYFVCLEDWSEEMKEAGDHKKKWYNKMKDVGLKVKLALNEDGVACGMIEYLPVEYSIAEGHDLYFINCIWVHGHKQGIGNWQKKGFGKALLKAAEDDVRMMGKKGIAAFGVSTPFWIRASWYKKQGYVTVDKGGIILLLLKSFEENVNEPSLIRQKKAPKKNENPGKVTVTAIFNGYCPGQNMMIERAKRVSEEFGDKVVCRIVDTSDRETYLDWGVANALYIEDKLVSTGPPLTYKKIKKLINSKVRAL